MLIAIDIALFIVIATACWRGYRGTSPWLDRVGSFIRRLLMGRSFAGQLLRFAPMAVGWLMLCHWVNTAGWHATAAGGILTAMTIALDAMRRMEEQQKTEKTSCEDS